MSEKMLIRTSDSVFLNSKSVFIEYIDVIKSPYFLLLYALNSSEEQKVLKEPFDVEIIKHKTPEELAKWYYTRKNQNPLIDLIPDSRMSTTNFDKVDEFMDTQLRENKILVSGSSPLNFVDVLKRLMVDSLLVHHVYIWYPYDNPNIKEDIKSLFNNDNIEFVHGDIESCLKEVPDDSTYVFSDITNILVLEEIGKLDMSSILLPIDFQYNLDEEEHELINLEELQKEHVFKINHFVSTSK